MATDEMDRSWVNVLAEVPLFAGLSQRQLGRVAKRAKLRRFPALTTILRQGDRGDAFFVILDGEVSVRTPGRRTVRLGHGDAFGELALLDGAPRTATVQAEEETRVMLLSEPAFRKLLESEPKIAVALLRTLAGRLRDSQKSPVS